MQFAALFFESGGETRRCDPFYNILHCGIEVKMLKCSQSIILRGRDMVWWIIATLGAFFVKGLCGFANTLVFSSVLSFGMDNINISPVDLVLGYPSNVIIAWKERKASDWKIWSPLAFLVLLGNIPGILLLKNVNAQFVKIFFGFVIIGIGAEMLLREKYQRKTEEKKVILGIIGVVSGVLCGLYGIGALLAAYMGRVTEDNRSFRANICSVFVIENTFRIVVYAWMGIITFDVIKRVILLVPLMLAGLLMGMRSSRILDDKLVKKIVIIMLIISGVVLIINNL